jgi:hypothetical protein
LKTIAEIVEMKTLSINSAQDDWLSKRKVVQGLLQEGNEVMQ